MVRNARPFSTGYQTGKRICRARLAGNEAFKWPWLARRLGPFFRGHAVRRRRPIGIATGYCCCCRTPDCPQLQFIDVYVTHVTECSSDNSCRVSSRQGAVEQAQVAAYTSMAVGLLLASVTAVFTIVFREHIALLYNKTPEVVTMASHLMLLAALYQLSDAVQVIGSGVLRGYKDTRSIFFITFTAYWLLGLPSGYLLGLTDYILPAMGPAGFWIGFIIGLTAAAILMVLRIRWLQKQPTAFILQRAAH